MVAQYCIEIEGRWLGQEGNPDKFFQGHLAHPSNHTEKIIREAWLDESHS